MKFRGFAIGKIFVTTTSQWGEDNVDIFALGYTFGDAALSTIAAIRVTVLGMTLWLAVERPAEPAVDGGWRTVFHGGAMKL